MLILILPVAALGQERTGQDRRESAADRELRRRPWMRLLARAENADEFLTSLTDKVDAHNRRVETLLTSDEGKHIASDGATLMTFIRVYEEPVVSASDVRRRKEAASSILRSVRVKQDSLGAGDPPAEDLQDEADELFFWSKERLARLSAQETALDALRPKPREGFDLSRAKTLKKAIDDYRATWYELISNSKIIGDKLAGPEGQKILVDAARIAYLERVEAERKRLQDETKAQIEHMRLEFGLKLKRMRRDQQALVAQAQIEADEARDELRRLKGQADADRYAKNVDAGVKQTDTIAAAERERKISLARSAEVQQLLAPFLADGYWQPGKRQGGFDKGPVSFSAIGAGGALQPTVGGLRKLMQLGRDKKDKERPRWGYPQRINKLSAEQRDELKRAQEYLIELGVVMVELGMLAP